MRRSVAMPHGSWPLEMRAETAAAYCDEPSVEAFLAKVGKGLLLWQSRRSAVSSWAPVPRHALFDLLLAALDFALCEVVVATVHGL